ncbi:MAG: dihydroorotate dehydrogenase [Rhodobacteraceae bacterium]|nr:dihydroorotate dehydrogenase [Paracoccaceae bacterium]MCW9041901.1 dihydroorotate dehydrogenase [Pseudopelagicola sp.]
MADKYMQDHDLDALFAAAARDTAQDPSADLLARVLADAEAVQPKAMPIEASAPRRGMFDGILAVIGGWPSLGGLAAATVAGVWIGFSATPTVLPDGLASLVGQSDTEYLAYLDTSYAYLEEDVQ